MKPAQALAMVLASASVLVAGVAAETIQINGAGATFPYPNDSNW